MSKKTCAAIIVAAGNASRMGGIDKTVTPIGGVPMILRTVRALAASERMDEIIIVTRPDLIEPIEKLCVGVGKPLIVVRGGNCRAGSVLLGLEACHSELCAIHDGARPFVTTEVIEAAVSAGETFGGAAPAIALKDTVKRARDGKVLETPDRASLFAVQTPQVFYTERISAAIREALEKGLPLTDDCSAAEAMGMEVHLTPGDEENMKITTPFDLVIGEAILKRREQP